MKPASPDSLQRYWSKRDFSASPEPRGARAKAQPELAFVVQKHAARQLHYDFRLELDGTLKSWAIPKGPSLDPSTKRMAVHVEDHPLDYAGFEGTIPAGHYGAGEVIVWDRGRWQPEGDAAAGLAAGMIKFRLAGEKLRGAWMLVRMKAREGERQEPWLLIKERDAEARRQDEFDVLAALPDSVLAGRPKRGAAKTSTAPKSDETAEAAPPRPAARTARSTKAPALELPAQATPAALPAALKPALATLVERQPASGNWIYEIKFDGYRMLARIEHAKVLLQTRNGHDWTARLPALAAAIGKLALDSAWLDGELVVMGEHGVPDFQALQNAFDGGAGLDAARLFLFDLPFYGGHDLRAAPLVERRALLERLLAAAGPQPMLAFSRAFTAADGDLLESARGLHLEGLIGKQAASRYLSGRSGAWIKLKCGLSQEFVIGGYTAPRGARTALGSLLLGVYDEDESDEDGALRYAGNVGTGFDEATLRSLHARLKRLDEDRPAFADPPPARGVQWVAPRLVAEVSFTAWTSDGHIRHAVFKGLREDKPARQIRRESAMAAPPVAAGTAPRPAAAKSAQPARGTSAANATQPARPSRGTSAAAAKSATTAKAATTQAKAAATAAKTAPTAKPPSRSPRITNADRIIDPASGATKGELVDYCEAAAALLLPHLADRPIALLRAPQGVEGTSFFQKHADVSRMPGLRELDPALDSGHDPLIGIDTRAALQAAAQMNVVEFHTWNATTRAIEKPDRMVFDLDPGEGVGWKAVLEAAQLVHGLLDALGLASFVKTSGGKGLHVVVPLTPRDDWAAVKDFSQAVVQHLAAHAGERFVAVSGARNRVGRIFVDYLRNGRGATTAAAYSPRARPGLGVSLPLDWSEVPALAKTPQVASIRTPLARLEAAAKTWAAYAKSRQTLTRAMKNLGFTPSPAGRG